MAVRREIHPVRHRGGFRSPVHQLHLAVAVQLIDCSKASPRRPCKHRGHRSWSKGSADCQSAAAWIPRPNLRPPPTPRDTAPARRVRPSHVAFPITRRSLVGLRLGRRRPGPPENGVPARLILRATSPQSVPRDPSPTRCHFKALRV